MPFEVLAGVEKTKCEIEELLSEDSQSIDEELTQAYGIRLEGEIVKQTLPKSQHMRRKKENREYNKVTYTGGMNFVGHGDAQGSIDLLKAKVLQNVHSCLDEHFWSLKQDVYGHMQWLDPANWDDDNTTAELDSLQALGQHFSTTLGAVGYDETCVKREWKTFRNTVKHFYPSLKCKALWKKIFLSRRKDFTNVCLLAEIVFSFGVSNSVVEAGFSRLTALLSDRRLSISHDLMTDYMLIKINDLSFTEGEKQELIASAIKSFLRKRRKHKLQCTPSASDMCMLSIKRQKRDAVPESDEDEGEHEVESSDNETSSNDDQELSDSMVNFDDDFE